MKALAGALLLAWMFVIGVFAGLNVATMYPHPEYPAAWWRVVIAIVLYLFTASIFIGIVESCRNDKR